VNTCPRCHGHLIAEPDGGAFCFCGHREEGKGLDFYAELMATAPEPTRAERHEQAVAKANGGRSGIQRRQAQDLQRAKNAAARYGVSLEDLQKPMRNWKRVAPKVRVAYHSVIADLTFEGLGNCRIAKVLCRHPRTIQLSPGQVRGRARRKSWTQ